MHYDVDSRTQGEPPPEPGNGRSLTGASALFFSLDDPSSWPLKENAKALEFSSDAGETLKAHLKHPGCYRDAEGDLGPYVRWLLALRLLLRLHRPDYQGWPWGQFRCHHEHSARDHLLELLLPHLRRGEDATNFTQEFFAAFRLDKNGWKDPGKYYVGRVFECIMDALALKTGRWERLSWHRFFEVRNLMPGAPVTTQVLHRFEQWLQHEIHPPSDDLTGLEIEHLPWDLQERRAQVRQVITGLTAGDASLPVVNIHAPASRTNLRALASVVLYRLQRLRHQLPVASRGSGLVYIPLCEKSNGLQRVTRTAVSDRLRHCFGLSARRAEPLRGPPDLAWDVADLRRGLSTYPTVVVFDAVEVNTGPLGAVLDYIQDAHWEDYIRALIQPDFEVLRQSGQPYPSRFLVLSNRAIRGLEPWAFLQEELCAGVYQAGRQLVEEPERFAASLKRQRLRLGAEPSRSPMHEVYACNQEKLDLVFKTPSFVGAPTEADLTMARLLPTEDLRAVLVGSMQEGAGRPAARARLMQRWMEAHAGDGDAAASLILVLMIAASVDGLRLPTLVRTVRRWVKVVPIAPEPAQRIERMARQTAVSGQQHCRLMERFPSLLLYRIDPDTPGVGVAQRRFELVDSAAAADAIDPASAQLLDIRLIDVRRLILDAFAAPGGTTHGPAWLGVARAELWASINLVLSEEALRQATSQARNLDARDLNNPYVHRRMVHAIYHGLLSHVHEPAERRTSDAVASEGDASSPAAKRYRLQYLLLFRDSVEGASDWMLGRGFARSELRFQLLLLFAAPSIGRKPVDAPGAVEPGSASETEWLDQELCRRDIEEQDTPLYLDLLEALGRAAYDTGRHSVVRLVAWHAEYMLQSRWQPSLQSPPSAIGNEGPAHAATIDAGLEALEHSLRHLRAQTAHALQQRSRLALGPEMKALAFLKLRIDSLQARRELTEAKRLCMSWLDRHAPGGSDLLGLGATFTWPSKEQPATASEHKLALDTALGERVGTLLARCADHKTAEGLADLLSRVGEILATEADSRADWRQAGPEYLDAYAVYWIADRIRSGAGEYLGTMRWPKVSARPARYYIRVSLKVARVMAHGAHPHSEAMRCALDFFDHARNRLDVYSRHLFHWPRERLAMLLLMAASSRVWHEIAGNSSRGGLDASLGYILRAESLAIELGLPQVVSYRVFFERIKTARRLLEAGGPDKVLRQLIDRDLDVLGRLAKNNPFWSDLVARQRTAVQALGNDAPSAETSVAPIEPDRLPLASVFRPEHLLKAAMPRNTRRKRKVG